MKEARKTHSRPAKSAEEQRTGVAHDEWLIEEAIEETFPASDPTSPSRPDSTVASKYRARKEKPTK
jgi:hypothetical protein